MIAKWFFQFESTGVARQSDPIFRIDGPSMKIFVSTTSYQFRNQWNSLPPLIKTIDDQEHFSILIKRFLGANFWGNTRQNECWVINCSYQARVEMTVFRKKYTCKGIYMYVEIIHYIHSSHTWSCSHVYGCDS